MKKINATRRDHIAYMDYLFKGKGAKQYFLECNQTWEIHRLIMTYRDNRNTIQ